MAIVETDLGRHVTQKRQEKGWSQRELGRRAGVRGATISKLESGATQPTNDTIVKVARALGEKEEALLRLAGHLPAVPPATDLSAAVCRAFRSLGETQQNAVATLIFDLAGGERAVPAGQPAAPAQRSQLTDVVEIDAVWDDVCTELEYCGLLLHEDCADGARIERHFRVLSSALVSLFLDTVGNRDRAGWAQSVHRLLKAHRRRFPEDSAEVPPKEKEPDE